MTSMSDLKTPHPPNWCPGCGNISIWGAFKQAAVNQGWDNTNTALVAGIGCHGHMLNFVKITSLEGLHGRPLPVATGIKLANQKLNVFVFTGDGDCFGEGGNHFIHTCRRNHDLTVIIHDNSLYALTTGQTSPRTPQGLTTKSTPQGNPDEPINPLSLAIISGATFVARAYAGDMEELTDLITKANEHKGLSIIDVLQPCISFNKSLTHDFYRERIYYLGSDYDPTDKDEALARSRELESDRIPLGIFYNSDAVEKGKEPQKALIENEAADRDLDKLFRKYI